MLVRSFQPRDRDAWDVYVLGHPEGSAYQMIAWKEAVEAAYGFNGCYLLAVEGTEILGVLPLIDFQIPMIGRAFISLPYCDVGGVLANNEEIAAVLLESARQKAMDARAGCKIRSSHPLPVKGPCQTGKVRMLLSLPTSSEQLLAGLKSKLRSQVKKPLRDGLTVKMGGIELIDQFYNVFCHNMRDLGSPVHSRCWIEAIISGYGERARIGVVLTPDGDPAAAGIILWHPTTMSIPWASSLRKYNHFNANMLLYWTFLAFAADQCVAQFDFGRSTPGEGTYRFKEQWGAEPRQLYWHNLTGDKETSSVSSKRQLAANLWSRLPEAGASWLGPRIRKYISL